MGSEATGGDVGRESEGDAESWSREARTGWRGARLSRGALALLPWEGLMAQVSWPSPADGDLETDSPRAVSMSFPDAGKGQNSNGLIIIPAIQAATGEL